MVGASVVREATGLADVVLELQLSTTAWTLLPLPQRVPSIVPVLVQGPEEVERASRGELQALTLVEPQHVARKTDVDLDLGAQLTVEGPLLGLVSAVGTLQRSIPRLRVSGAAPAENASSPSSHRESSQVASAGQASVLSTSRPPSVLPAPASTI